METNQRILLDRTLAVRRAEAGADLSESEYFEIFCVEQILKDYNLTYDEIEAGIVDGGNDGGIDSIYAFVDENLMEEESEYVGLRRNANVRLVIIQSKITAGFPETPINALTVTLRDLLNFANDLDDLKDTYNPLLLGAMANFRTVFLALQHRFPNLRVDIYYATRGMVPSTPARRRSEHVIQVVRESLPQSESQYTFLGAGELLSLARNNPIEPSELVLAQAPIPTNGGFIALVGLADYFRFISDRNGKLRKNLFEFNVRDYQGRTEVNEDIRSTLQSPAAEEDFWWLNNGITILCARSTQTNVTLTLDDPQIVNGLQTSTEIFKYFEHRDLEDNGSRVLVRVLTPQSEASRDRIIKATNFQAKISDASLRATDAFQRDIEQYFLDHNLYYDRRKTITRMKACRRIESSVSPFWHRHSCR